MEKLHYRLSIDEIKVLRNLLNKSMETVDETFETRKELLKEFDLTLDVDAFIKANYKEEAT